MKNYNQTIETLHKCEKEIYGLRENFRERNEGSFRTELFAISHQIFALIEGILDFAKEDE